METEQPPVQAPALPNADPPASLRRNWKWPVSVVLGLMALIVLVVLYERRGHGAVSANPVTVAVAKVVRENLAQEQTFEAEFRPYQEIDLHAKVAGFVQKINVDIGDEVRAGELLATLEIPELSQDIDRANAEVSRDEKDIARSEAAYQDSHLAFTRLSTINQTQPNLIAQQDLDTAQAKDAAAEADVAAARAQAMVARSELAKLNAEEDFCKITAPFAGVITRRYADEGALIQGGVTPSATAMPLVRLSQNDRLRLDFPVSVSYVSRIKIGDPVEIRIQSPPRTIQGNISRFARKVNTDTRTMEAEVEVTNDNLSLTPGIYAVATLKLDQRENVLTVPAEAIANPRAPTLFVLNKDNQIEERPVTIGLETATRVEIASGSVNENDLVMIGSRAQVNPGQKVEPKIVDMGATQP